VRRSEFAELAPLPVDRTGRQVLLILVLDVIVDYGDLGIWWQANHLPHPALFQHDDDRRTPDYAMRQWSPGKVLPLRLTRSDMQLIAGRAQRYVIRIVARASR